MSTKELADRGPSGRECDGPRASRRERARAVLAAGVRTRSAWRTVLVVWLASRAFFLAVGALAATFVEDASHELAMPRPGGVLAYWANWDGAWYVRISAEGYRSSASTAFFPVYPLVVRAGTELGGSAAVWGVVVSSLALLFALYFLYRLAEERWGPDVATASTLALAFFPTAFFLNAVYTEALFLAMTTGALWAVYVRRDLLLAGFFAYFAGATRNVGVVLALPLAYEWLRHRREFGWESVLGVLAAPAGLATYALYLWKGTANPLLFALAQRETWGRSPSSPLTTLENAWNAARGGTTYLRDPGAVLESRAWDPSFALSCATDLIVLALSVALLAVGLMRLPAGLALYAVPLALGPLFTASNFLPLMSLSRYVLVAFPLVLVLGILLARSWILLVPVIAASAAAGAYFTVLFTTWRWVA